jgi:cytoskeletal protein CcmA (bactofilin family)
MEKVKYRLDGRWFDIDRSAAEWVELKGFASIEKSSDLLREISLYGNDTVAAEFLVALGRHGNVTFLDDWESDGDVYVTGSLTGRGSFRFKKILCNGNLNVDGDLEADEVHVGGQLVVGGRLTVNGDIGVVEAVNARSVVVSGNADCRSLRSESFVRVGGKICVEHRLEVMAGTLSAESVSCYTLITGDVKVEVEHLDVQKHILLTPRETA